MTLITTITCSCSDVPDPPFEPVRFFDRAAAVISLFGIPTYGIVSSFLHSTLNSAMMKWVIYVCTPAQLLV